MEPYCGSVASVCVFVVAVFCTSLQSCQSATSPGLKLRVSQTGLNYASSVAVDIMADQMKGMPIPPMSGQTGTIVGTVSYGFSNIKIASLQKPSTLVTVNVGSGLTWAASGASITVNGNWNYAYRPWFFTIADGGGFTASVSGASVSVSIAIGASAAGQPTISSTGCSCSLGQVSVTLSGSIVSWFYNMFIGLFTNPLKSFIEPMMCQEARKAIDTNGAKQLDTFKVRIPILNQWLFDYSLVSPPAFAADYIESAHKAEFFYQGDNTEAPFQPASLQIPSTSRMVTMAISEYTINTIGYTVYQHNVMSFAFDTRLPLGNVAASNAVISVQLSASAPPAITISGSSVRGNLFFRARLAMSNSPIVDAKFNASVTVIPSFDGKVLTATPSSISMSLRVLQSSIGYVPDDDLTAILNFGLNTFVMPMLSDAGRRGMPIPHVDFVSFPNAALQLQQGYGLIMTDVHYP